MNKLENLKSRLKMKFEKMAVPMDETEFTRENYDKFFPDSKVLTPVGEVKLGGHQFLKLEARKRQHLLGAMHQTLTDPVVIIYVSERKTLLFSGSFFDSSNKLKIVISVVIAINGTKVSISTHTKDLNNIINKIKKDADLIYEKPDNVRTAGNGTTALANKSISDTQLNNNLPQIPENVNNKKH